jgi:lipoyl-dependent peroxiredoxin
MESHATVPQFTNILFTAKVCTTGGRDGTSHSDDGRLEINLSTPGTSGTGTNPEQLFASAWSACFISSMKIEASKRKITLPTDLTVDAEVDLGTVGDAYALAVRLNVSAPGIDSDAARGLAEAACQICPFFRATRGNINLVITVR